MKCAYCLEEMNEGATVCKVCAREQPPSKEEAARRKDNRAFIAAMVVLALFLVFIIWVGLDGFAKSSAVDRIVDCLHSKGDASANATLVKSDIDSAMTQTGKGWRASLPMAAMTVAYNGRPNLAVCYVRSDNIISEMKGD